MTEDQWRARIDERLSKVEISIQQIQTRVETRDAVGDVHRHNVERELTAIKSSLQRLLWIFIGPLVAAAMTFVIKGGLAGL